ncbi:MAG: hypothetical protein M5U14_00375 [Acidimicrobiia bacterium]|nr:hypothetical protein [Acidimicrobiia bacterium]
MSSSRAFRRGVGTGIAAVLALLVALALFATTRSGAAEADDPASSAEEPDRETRLEEWRACLEEQGVTLPERTEGEDGRWVWRDLSEEERAALRDAAEACGLPGPRGFRGHGRAALTDEQRACLDGQGVTLPERTEGEDGRWVWPDLSEEERAALRDAAEACGLPGPRGFRGHGRAALTDEQRACLDGQGVTLPERTEGEDGRWVWRDLSEEERAALRDAAEACGLGGRGRCGPGVAPDGEEGGEDGATGTGLVPSAVEPSTV